MNHPFAGRKGSALRDRFAATLYANQHGACRMCGITIDPTLRGTRDSRAAVVDHVRPWRLDPAGIYKTDNLQLICRRCHATCDGIEKRHWPDADRIAAEKRRGGGFGADGWPLWPE